uniref:Thyrotropin-releasing hormone receptor n=1 Tax=Castor canadensis TaxID=51338 RepID=A0A8C0ZTX4_CASCN
MDSPSDISVVHEDGTLGLPEHKAISVLLAMVVLVVVTTRDMHTLTNCYLVGLALADLIVLMAAGLPNISESLAGQWGYGHAGCLGITHFQYLGINVSSCSIRAFTVEREVYIAICHPMQAQTICTVARAKRIISGIWGVTAVYCLLWFFLVDLNIQENRRLECGYKVSRSLYLPIYLLDFTVFFVTPLLVAIVLYGLIGRILFQSPLPREAWREAGAEERQPCSQGRSEPGGCGKPRGPPGSRMLAVVVLLFAVLWMPNCTLPLLDPWVLLFCRTCVYTNSAINPIIYNLMSQKFRAAFQELCRCGMVESQRRSACLITSSCGMARETLLGTKKTQSGSSETSDLPAAGSTPHQQEPVFSMV